MGRVEISFNKTLDDIDIPKTVYKYRCWDNPFHKTILTNRVVYMAAPSSYEDKLDCKFPIRYDLLSDKDIYDYYYQYSLENYKARTRQQHRSYARDWAKHSNVRNPKRIKENQEQTFNDYDERVGILSLTANPVIAKMWKDYACDHQGFSVGFDSRIMFEYLGGGGEVIYVDDIPVIHPYPKHSYDEQRQLQIFHKLSNWSYEEEYRTTIFRPEPLSSSQRTIQLPSEAFKELIFGEQCSAENIDEILAIISKELKHVELKRAIFKANGMYIESL